MRQLLTILNYSHLFIGICAFSFTLFTSWIYHGLPLTYQYSFFVFFATVSLYSVHRLIGLSKMRKSQYEKTRYAQISKLKLLIQFSFILSAVITIILFFSLSIEVKYSLLPAAILGMAYTLPVFPQRHRLRDYPFIKIIAISLVWAIITAWIPLTESGIQGVTRWTVSLERFLFIWAITIPFDIRDFSIDRLNGVKTIPGYLGIDRAKILAYLLCLADVVIIWVNSLHTVNHESYIFAWSFTLILTFLGIYYSTENRQEFYYSFLIDGLMIIPLIIIIMIHLMSIS